MPAELKLLVVSPSVKNWPVLLGLGLLTMLTGIFGLILLILTPQTALLITAMGVSLTVWPALSAAHTEFTVTNLRVVIQEGVLSKTAREIPVSQVREIRVARTKVQELLGIGDLELIGDGVMLKLEGVEDPAAIKEKIRTLS